MAGRVACAAPRALQLQSRQRHLGAFGLRCFLRMLTAHCIHPAARRQAATNAASALPLAPETSSAPMAQPDEEDAGVPAHKQVQKKRDGAPAAAARTAPLPVSPCTTRWRAPRRAAQSRGVERVPLL